MQNVERFVGKKANLGFQLIGMPRVFCERQHGAARVVWLRATPEHLDEGLARVLPDFDGLPGIVVEGTNVARYRGDVYLLAARPPIRKIKPSARATLERADWTVLNLREGWTGGGTELLEQELPAFFSRPPLPFRGMQPEAEENRALAARVKAALPPLGQ